MADFRWQLNAVPFLSALTELSNLQRLALPLLTELSHISLQCLAGLKTLRMLGLTWRPIDPSELCLHTVAWQPSISVMASLTALSLRGHLVNVILGLPCCHACKS